MIIFDLDGTISDPSEGITKSISYAMVQLGYPPRPSSELLRYIGPPLAQAFSELLNTQDEELIDRAVALYRERYATTGYAENRLYDGMAEALQKLYDDGSTLYIATSKRKDIALKVLDYFGIASVFSQVHGCSSDKSKGQLLRDVLHSAPAVRSRAVMVGDRSADFIAAADAGIPSVGVSWGFGEKKELALANAVATNPEELLNLIGVMQQPVSLSTSF